jgi:hypothetical protein
MLWRAGPGEEPTATRNFARLEPVMEALAGVGVSVEVVLYRDEAGDVVRERLLGCGGVLVWVDPITDDQDRSRLDAMLADVASEGVWVSTHPEVIAKMGTKEVIYRTKALSWGTDASLYASRAALRAEFPRRLATAGPRVLKRSRGNGGAGVWKVTLLTDDPLDPNALVRVQHAAPRNDTTEVLRLEDFMERCGDFFVPLGTITDQPFLAGVSEGMVRAYVVEDQVVGFARQRPAPVSRPDRVLGMASAKTMFDAEAPEFASLRDQLERTWIPQLVTTVGLGAGELPMLWDADFLLAASDEPGYRLCEINVSSVLPFPPQAPGALARAVRRRLQSTPGL